jgi:hypothetical protein
MPIKNKDGTLFKLESPNPIMSEQMLWEKDQMIIHNMPKFGQPVVMKDSTEPVKQAFDKMPIVGKITEPTQEQELPTIVKTTEPPTVVKKDIPDIVDKLDDDGITTVMEGEIDVWCLPAKYVEVVDSIYDQKYKKLKYGNKFIFQGYLIEQADLFTIIWTKTKAVSEGSIIYPKIMDKRWWRVTGTKEEEGGYLLYAEITDYHPNFSE